MLNPFKACNLDIFRSLKAGLKERNNSVFGMPIAGEMQRDYDLWVDMFLLRSTNT